MTDAHFPDHPGRKPVLTPEQQIEQLETRLQAALVRIEKLEFSHENLWTAVGILRNKGG